MKTNEIKITQRSGWSSIQRIIGLFLIVIGLVLLLLSVVDGKYFDSLAAGTLIFVGVQSLFIAFLIDVFTDIRWHLSNLFENSELTNNYLGHQYRRTQSENL